MGIGMLSSHQDIEHYLDNHLDTIDKIYPLIPSIMEAAGLIKEAFDRGNKLLLCGNGGSAADCQHMAAELVASGYPAIALTTDTSILTALSNDFSYNEVFIRQAIAVGEAGDVLMVLSTSGKSQNILRCLGDVRIIGAKTIALTGQDGLDSEIANLEIRVPSTNTQHIQESHIMILHIIWQLVIGE